MFDVPYLVASLNGEDGPRGLPSHETLSVEISSVAGHPPSLVRDHFSSPRVVVNCVNVLKGSDFHPNDRNIQIFTDPSNIGWDAHLEQDSVTAVLSDRKKSHTTVFLALKKFRDHCPNHNFLVATDNSTVVAYTDKQGGTHSAKMCALLWRIMTLCHHYKLTLRVRHIPGCLNVMTNSLSRSNKIQSTEWSLHPQLFKQISQKWFTPHVKLFATHLNHKVPLYVSPVPEQHAWDIDALNINWSGLIAYAYPPMAPPS